MTLADGLRIYRLPLLWILCLTVALYTPILGAMIRQWFDDPNYSHGFFIPVVAGFFVYLRRRDLNLAEFAPSSPGLLLILAALLLLVTGRLAGELFLPRFSFVLLLAGYILFFTGRKVLGLLMLPLAYLLLMIPLPYLVYNALTLPLKLAVTRISVVLLHLSGVAVINEGNILIFPNITLEVADACSGIRSLISFLALGIAYAVLVTSRNGVRLLIVLVSLLIALLVNVVRVVVTGFLAERFGASVARGFFHEFTGLVVFLLGLGLLAGIAALLVRRR